MPIRNVVSSTETYYRAKEEPLDAVCDACGAVAEWKEVEERWVAVTHPYNDLGDFREHFACSAARLVTLFDRVAEVFFRRILQESWAYLGFSKTRSWRRP